MLKLEPVYKEDEADFVMLWKSNPLKNYVELTNQSMGFGKLVFLRTTWPDFIPHCLRIDAYCHMGVGLARRDGGVDFIEVKNDKGVFKVIKRNTLDAMLEERGSKTLYDNICLRRRGAPDPNRSLFRISRLLNKTVEYDVSQLNCDHIATSILTGDIAWTTGPFNVAPTVKFPGEVTKLVMQGIENQLAEPI